ncbi:MAG: LD-carboxypeptidase [Deltaproteobacteria bacterium]|nr:LD-carboxypeptidase [Deltaproteobacteria bacterium]MBW1994086.1 LD-carboxypeptidase [Deltaproteobacteria bacterium]MBW2153080.1 LD-carboxypeptidase [Deltaproteobacteria bacterium]
MSRKVHSTPIYPKRLIKGDTIGVVAPASPFDENRFYTGIEVLKAMGFKVVYAQGLFHKDGYLAGSDYHRSVQLQRFFEDDSIKGIICARGGFGSIRVLPYLNFKSIENNPKCFIGFSDITALLSTFFKESALVTFHGPTIMTLATASKKSRDAFLAAVSFAAPIRITTSTGITLQAGVACGRVVGGNLTTLCHLLGTPFQPELDGRILIIEDTGETGYRIDRMLTQMKLSGCLNGIVGLGLGSFRGCGKIEEIYRIVQNIFFDMNIPVLGGLPIGHGRTNLTIPLGAVATLDSVKKELIFHEPATT